MLAVAYAFELKKVSLTFDLSSRENYYYKRIIRFEERPFDESELNFLIKGLRSKNV